MDEVAQQWGMADLTSPQIVALIASEEPYVNWAANDRLIGRGKIAIEALLAAALTDRSKQVRRRALFYLSQQRPDPRVPPALESLLSSETDPILRRRARVVLACH